MKIQPNDPAALVTLGVNKDGNPAWIEVVHSLSFPGLTIRAEMAARSMQGILASLDSTQVISFSLCDVIAKEAVRCADALIKELNKPKPGTDTGEKC